MNLTIVIHTEDKDKLSKLFKLIEKNPNKKYFSLYLHAKGYIPWEDDELKKVIVSYRRYDAFPTLKSNIESVVEIISKVNDDRILILDEDCDFFNLNEWDNSNLNFLLSSKEDIVKLNLDTKYQTLKWFIVDLISQKNKTKVDISDDSEDSVRYFKKIESPIFYEKIIYVDGGMGDHIMALPLLEKIQNNIHICCKYPFVFEHLKFKGIIHWDDDLFGGYRRFVYEYGSVNNSKTIIDAFFEMYGYVRHEDDLLIYNGVREKNQINTNGKPIALICSSAAKIQNLDSNKDWRDIRWLKLVHELQKQNYFVIQVGTIKDSQIPTVDLKYLDKPLSELVSLIDDSSLWISVDTFFHHFASSIKPNVGICLTPFYNDHAKHKGVTYIEKDCGKDFSDRKWWTDLQQPERKECMDLIQLEDVLPYIKDNISRIDIINSLIKKHNYKTYLEIGVRNPDDCLNYINCDLKHGVDPGIEGNYPVTFNMTSDEFFKINKSDYDIIFIDGLHIDEQVERDIINSLSILNKNGSIVLHDCNPPQIYHAREDYEDHSTPARWDWNGTVWKAIVKIRSEIDGIYTSVIDTDWGVGIIQKSEISNKIINDNPFYSYNKFSKNRVHYLNLISTDEFISQYINNSVKQNNNG
jgi:ADP-heptose:LPS heptosyltransferase